MDLFQTDAVLSSREDAYLQWLQDRSRNIDKAPEHSPNCVEFPRCFCPAWFHENS